MNQPAFLYATWLATASVAATSTATGLDAADVLQPTEDTGWAPNVLTASALVVDRATTGAFDAVALLGRGLDGVTLEVRESSDNFAASDVQLLAPVALSAPVNAAWAELTTAGDKRWVKYIFTGFGSDLLVAHVAACELDLLPWLASDWDPDALKVDGEHLTSQDGYYLGSVSRKAMAELALEWGTISETEYLPFKALRDAVIAYQLPFFFVPDTAAAVVHFGWAKGEWGAPQPVGGLRKVDTIKFTTRAR